ncbi:hypothetical protein [Oceanobacillus jeddahense]|uniref:hypothetical protein n=1 Tax=Oceanobacillus jeddahense TaxID=1462527 RepID=UPI00059608D7|nr:hypothetical protein [Oceanobacillus jeddahense]
MHIILTIILGYSFINIFETIYYLNYEETYLGTNLIWSWALHISCVLFLIAYFIFRKYNQNKYINIANETIEEDEINPGEFYYQLPIVTLMEKMPIKVLGQNNAAFELYFNSTLHRTFFMLGLFSAPPGLKLSSNENTIILKSKKWLRYEYTVYVNGDYHGEFNAKRLVKERGVKNYIHFDYHYNNCVYNLTNDYFDMTTYIKDDQDTLLFGERTYFNLLSKDEKTGRRGEKHKIKMDHKQNQSFQEVLLALYITALNIRNH